MFLAGRLFLPLISNTGESNGCGTQHHKPPHFLQVRFLTTNDDVWHMDTKYMYLKASTKYTLQKYKSPICASKISIWNPFKF